QRTEQDLDAEALVLRVLAAVDQRREEETGGEEAGGDPEERALRVPGAGQRIGEPLRNVNAVELRPFHRVVRGEAAKQDLEDKQGDDDKEIFSERALGRRQRKAGERVQRAGGQLAVVIALEDGPAEHEE